MGSLYERISKGTMTVNEITDSMRAATSEGGRFYQSMEKQSQTLNGQLSTLKDNADQLLGSLTEGVSEGLRDQILPFANNLVGELQTAFETGGYQGLVDTATDMIPDLLGLMTGELQDGIAGLTRWLPQGATKLMQALPAALRAATAVVPQITRALFEVSNQVIYDLIAMLPELTPVLIGGFADLMSSSLRGFEGMIDSIIGGMVQAIHQGQTQVAGTWVENEQIAQFNFKIDTNLVEVETTIQSAYSEIRDILKTDLLSDDERKEIESMIGDDYDDIKAKLMTFGLSPDEAEPIAEAVSSAGKVIKDEIAKLDISASPETVAEWFAQADGSKIALTTALKEAGLKEEDVTSITALYDEMTGRVVDGTPNIMEEIYNKLTDGKPDDDQTVAALKEEIESYVGGLLTELEATYQAKLGELDITASDYEEKKQALDEWYTSTKESVLSMDAGMRSLVAEMANAPTSIVQAKMEEFAEIERTLLGIEQDIDRLNEKARSAAENAFQVVRSGAKADSATIEQAANLKYTEFKIDEQAAQDAYTAAVEQLNADLASGKITKSEYDESITIQKEQLASAKSEALAAYENALRDIFSGIAEAEGVDKALQDVAAKADLSNALLGFSEELSTQFGNLQLGDQLGEDFTAALAEHMGISPEVLKTKTIDEVRGALEGWSADLIAETQTALEGLDSTLVQASYSKMLSDGILAGTVFASETADEQLSTLFTNMYANASGTAAESVNAAVTEVATSATETAETTLEDGGESAGGYMDAGIARGVRNGQSKVISAVSQVANAAINTFKNLLGIQSPSKVMMELGEFTGQGYAIGLESSMRNAVAIAKRMTGQIVTAADITQTMRVSNMPNIQQDIVSANSSTPVTPVYLNGQKIAEIQGYNNSTQLAWQNTRAAKGVGSR